MLKGALEAGPCRANRRRHREVVLLVVVVAAAAVVGVAVVTSWCVLVGLGFLVLALPAARTVLSGATGPGLIPVLQQTGLAELLWAVLVAGALVVSG